MALRLPKIICMGKYCWKIIKRIEFSRDSRRQLTGLLDTLKVCNDGLLTIAPPAPGYYVSLSGADQILETSEPTSQPNHPFDIVRRPQSIPSGPLPQASQPRANAQYPIMSHSQGNPSNQTQEAKVYSPVIQLLHSTCLSTLRATVVRFPNRKANFEPVADRLSLWGSGTFTD